MKLVWGTLEGVGGGEIRVVLLPGCDHERQVRKEILVGGETDRAEELQFLDQVALGPHSSRL